jgi:hypothetical protein
MRVGAGTRSQPRYWFNIGLTNAGGFFSNNLIGNFPIEIVACL